MVVTEERDVSQILQKGIQAARRGRKQPARRLLAQVLQEEPDNEQAWMWLYRVTDSPSEKRECLQRVLKINPQNQWAADQLAALEAAPEAPAAPEATPEGEAAEAGAGAAAQPPVEPIGGETKVEALKCPNCGSSLQVRGGPETKTLVCSYCRSVVDLSQERAGVVSQIERKMTPAMPIEPGMECTFNGERYQVIGWIRYEGWDDEDRWRWDEWLLVSSDGRFLWMSYDPEAGFTLQRKIPIAEGFSPISAYYVPVPGGKARVVERAPARVVALAGELTWQAKIGDRFHYLDAKAGDRLYSVEYTQDAIELFEGKPLSQTEVWQAFGRDDLVQKVQKLQASKKRYRTLAVVCAIFAIFGCLATLFASATGREILEQNIQINQGTTEVQVGPFEVRHPNRPHRISLQTDLPVNSWAVVEVSAMDNAENEFYLFFEEFWDEEGRDSEGYWHESDVKASHLFRPDEAGPHYLFVGMEEASVSSIPLQIKVEDGVWQRNYFIGYTVFCFALVYGFASAGSGKLVGQAFVKTAMKEG